MNSPNLSPVLLNDLALIEVSGEEAGSFLQSQLTQDVSVATAERAALAGYCTARGRLLATMVVVRLGALDQERWLLMTRADAADALAQRLRMFVLRAKVVIKRLEQHPIGYYTQVAAANANEPYSIAPHDKHFYIRAPGATSRWWSLLQDESPRPDEAALQAWQAHDIASGLPWIQNATQELFIPQTLNMDLIDGVSFTKGCYPGQEVVARSHYRGTVKRRMAYATVDSQQLALLAGDMPIVDWAANLAGSDIYDAHDPEDPNARVINAAYDGRTLHLLMEVHLSDLDRADFRLGSGEGPALTITSLPYEIAPKSAKG